MTDAVQTSIRHLDANRVSTNPSAKDSQGQIDPIETENAPEGYQPNEWQKLDRIVHATIRMHLSELVYFTVQSCSTAF